MRSVNMAKAASALAVLLVSGCAVPQKPYEQGQHAQDADPSDSVFMKNYDYGNAPSGLVNLDGIKGRIDFSTNIEARAIRDAGRRLGATAGYNALAKQLYEDIEKYEEYLSKIFNFQSVMLPQGVIPPVIAQTEKVISYEGDREKTIRARVYRTLKDARLANPRAPSWRDYLNLGQVAVDYPMPQMKETIEEHRDIWEKAVEEGWDKGHDQARHAFEVSINRIERDFLGMQLFHVLWLAKMVEPPQVVEQEVNVSGGGIGKDEMSVGVRKVVINEDSYFVNDASQWNAIIAEAFTEKRTAASGLNDILRNIDNTGATPPAIKDSDLRRHTYGP